MTDETEPKARDRCLSDQGKRGRKKISNRRNDQAKTRLRSGGKNGKGKKRKQR